jgi:hypothetical protein
MNMLIEPVELQESECNAQGWAAVRPPDARDDDDATTEGPNSGVRVLAWTVERICALPQGAAH